MPYLGRYGADATSGPVSHSVASSPRPAEIAGVVEVLMRHDVLSGRSADAGGRWVADEPASSDTKNEASRKTEIGLLAEAFRERPRATRRMHPLPRPSARGLARHGKCTSYRGLPWGASHETEIVSPAEASCGEPRARRRLRQDAKTSCARLKARQRAWWARSWRVRGPRLTF